MTNHHTLELSWTFAGELNFCSSWVLHSDAASINANQWTKCFLCPPAGQGGARSHAQKTSLITDHCTGHRPGTLGTQWGDLRDNINQIGLIYSGGAQIWILVPLNILISASQSPAVGRSLGGWTAWYCHDHAANNPSYIFINTARSCVRSFRKWRMVVARVRAAPAPLFPAMHRGACVGATTAPGDQRRGIFFFWLTLIRFYCQMLVCVNAAQAGAEPQFLSSESDSLKCCSGRSRSRCLVTAHCKSSRLMTLIWPNNF